MTRVWENGRWVEASLLAVSPADRGLTLGLGLFETMAAVGGNLPLWSAHRERLRVSCERLGWKFPIQRVQKTVRDMTDGGSGKFRVRLAVSGGMGNLVSTAGTDQLWWLTAVPTAADNSPLALGWSPWKRNGFSPVAGMKMASYAENLIAMEHACKVGMDELLWENTAGRVCEATMANVFFVMGGVLVTPAAASGCLPGIMRGEVLRIARAMGIPSEEREIVPSEVAVCDAMFLTSAVKGISEIGSFGKQNFEKSEIIVHLAAEVHARIFSGPPLQ